MSKSLIKRDDSNYQKKVMKRRHDNRIEIPLTITEHCETCITKKMENLEEM